jgi:hypothetical protein
LTKISFLAQKSGPEILTDCGKGMGIFPEGNPLLDLREYAQV